MTLCALPQVVYAGRPAAAAPATGTALEHQRQTARVMEQIFAQCCLYGARAPLMVSGLPLWYQDSLYGVRTPFMVLGLPLWYQDSLYGIRTPFMVSGLPLWCQDSLYGIRTPFMVLRLPLWCQYTVYGVKTPFMVSVHRSITGPDGDLGLCDPRC